MTTGRAILGVVAGIAAGAVLGVLFAPEKGKDTRKKIYKGGEDLANALNDTIEQKFNELTKGLSGKFIRIKHDKEPMRKPEMSEQ